VDRVQAVDHDLNECVRRVARSPAACRHVLHELIKIANAGTLENEAKWASTLQALDKLQAGLTDRRRRPFWR
jgi:hypothetical protein